MKQRLCQWENCTTDISTAKYNAKYCAEHIQDRRNQQARERRANERAARQAASSKGGSAPSKLRYVRCSSCKEEYAIPYKAVDPLLCTFCDGALKYKAAKAFGERASNVKRLGRFKEASALNVDERITGYYIVYSGRYPEGKMMVARMVV